MQCTIMAIPALSAGQESDLPIGDCAEQADLIPPNLLPGKPAPHRGLPTAWYCVQALLINLRQLSATLRPASPSACTCVPDLCLSALPVIAAATLLQRVGDWQVYSVCSGTKLDQASK